MVQKSLVPTLAALAVAVAMAPTAAAVSIGDNDVKLTVGTQLQARAEVSRAKDAAGNDYDIQGGNSFSKSDSADFYMRRVRFSLKATYKDDWGSNLTLRADGADKNGTAARADLVQQAYIYRKFTVDDITHQLQIGIDYAYHNRATNVCSSSQFLLPNYTESAALLNNRAAGIGYRLNSKLVDFGVDIQNNKNDDSTAGSAATPNKSEGLWYSARVELTGPDQWNIAKDTESFAGKSGTGVRLGLDVAENSNDRIHVTGTPGALNNGSQSTLDYGVDLLFHWDGLTALTEGRWDTVKTKPDVGASPANVKRFAWYIQAGYAFPANGIFIEPAARFGIIDLDKSNKNEASVYGTAENGDFGGSGKQFDLGLNFYWAGHSSKTQVAYTNWKAEDQNGKASIFRVQQQLTF